MLHDDGLLMSEPPTEIVRLIQQRDAKQVAMILDAKRVEAHNERNRIRHIVEALENELARLPISVTLEPRRVDAQTPHRNRQDGTGRGPDGAGLCRGCRRVRQQAHPQVAHLVVAWR